MESIKKLRHRQRVTVFDHMGKLFTAIQINEKIAEIKRYLKTLPESKFMADRRDVKLVRHQKPQTSEKIEAASPYKPLGQILLDKKVLAPEQLEEALNIHWKKGVILGETLKELGYVDENDLKSALGIQKASVSFSIFKN